jgi:hypothetical protein
MSDAFWQGLFSNLAAIITAIGGVAFLAWQNSRNNQKSERRSREVQSRIESVKDVAITTADQAEKLAKGAERMAVEQYIETERNRASDLQALRADFKPESTDVFMERTK